MWHSYHKKIENKIINMPEGSVFVISDFSDIATDDTVSKTLTRLTENSLLKKLLRGVYWRPFKNHNAKTHSQEHSDSEFSLDSANVPSEESHPDPDSVALALARNNNQRVIPCGQTALHIMGLEENKPQEWTYITDGAYHKYTYNNVCIKFKHASGKLFSSMSDKTALVIQVLLAYGKDCISKEQLKKLKEKLSPEELKRLYNEARHTTVWVYEVIKDMLKQPPAEKEQQQT